MCHWPLKSRESINGSGTPFKVVVLPAPPVHVAGPLYILARIYCDTNSFSYVCDCPAHQPILIILSIVPVVKDVTTGDFSVAEITAVSIQHSSSINRYRRHTWHTVKINRWFAFQDFPMLCTIVRNQDDFTFSIMNTSL